MTAATMIASRLLATTVRLASPPFIFSRDICRSRILCVCRRLHGGRANRPQYLTVGFAACGAKASEPVCGNTGTGPERDAPPTCLQQFVV
jgi:hypothetical protein